ncbi:putative peptidoglycan lipid II flippase [Jatrophihabitans endophyticus]|uniref:Putative peptidoglycan lipid II flippase n=1 Tax=Jatrophihabitans endophyticus TaxID=1206085 RepID=A0A1M5HUQ2_9ACTN|nr:murein biosynthesis integral membrane protein MurJ [Jatrophihabitans endophyticus]SHG19658.1 putative peptidoglycan lipid II flippase [Jatrophihabitans endophyticus]
MTTRVTEDDWSRPTLYNATQAIEPRTFTELDPIGSVVVSSFDDGDEPTWGTTTLVGKPRHRRAASPTTEPTTEPDGTEPDGTAEPAPPEGTTPVEDDRSNRGLLAASGSMAVASLVSRITGFLRTIFIVAALGLAGVGNAYNSANTFPNMVYELLLGGVLSSVLVPLLVHAQSEDDDDGVAYTQRLLSLAAAGLGVMTILAVLAAPWISAAFVPDGPGRDLTSIFATLLLPEIFFYGLGAMFMAVLNIRHSYRAGAWSPVLNNVIMIATVLVFWLLPGPSTLDPTTITTTQIVVLGVGTTLGIAAQALVLVPSLRTVGFHWQWRFRARPEERGRMREVGVLAGWVLAYVVVSQVGVSIIQKVGNDNLGYSVFTAADLLFQMPYGILVVSLLTAIMPRLSRAALREDHEAVIEDLGLGARLSAIALVPITAGLIALGPVMSVTLFAYGETSIDGGHLIGSALAWSAFGLFPFALVMLQLRVFYAMRDGRTPTLINTFMVATKIVLVLVSNEAFAGTEHAVEWLNISTSLSYVVGAVVGHVVLTRRLGSLRFGPVTRTLLQIGFASVLGGAAAYGVVLLAQDALGAGHAGSTVALVGGGVAGLIVLGVVAWRMRIPAVEQAIATVRGAR